MEYMQTQFPVLGDQHGNEDGFGHIVDTCDELEVRAASNVNLEIYVMNIEKTTWSVGQAHALLGGFLLKS